MLAISKMLFVALLSTETEPANGVHQIYDMGLLARIVAGLSLSDSPNGFCIQLILYLYVEQHLFRMEGSRAS